MFNKKTKAQPASAPRLEPLATPVTVTVEPARKQPPKVASLISSDISIEGGVTGDGELQIDGIVRGDVRVARLMVGETGHVEGSVFAEAVEVRGRVVGAITAKQVRLYGTSYIDGDITHEQLAMETGAFFQGRSLKFQRPAQTTVIVPTVVVSPASEPQA